MSDEINENIPKITTSEGVDFVEKEEFVKDVSERFGMTEKQATVVYHMGLGDDIVDAVKKSYNYREKQSWDDNMGGSSRGQSNVYHQTTKLMNMHKFQQALDYINNEEYIDMRLKRYRLFLIDFARKKLRDNQINQNAQLGYWKTMMALSFEEKLPNEGKKVADNLKKLTDHFKEMDAKQKSPDFVVEKKDDEEEEKGDVRH